MVSMSKITGKSTKELFIILIFCLVTLQPIGADEVQLLPEQLANDMSTTYSIIRKMIMK